MGLGGLALVSLAEARELAVRHRKAARAGNDPIAERRRSEQPIPTFADAAKIVHAQNRGSWRNPKHAAQWLATLEHYAFPVLGDVRVDRIATPDILRALTPIWRTKAETARRVRQRIRTVLDWAKAAGHRSGDNPVDGVGKGLPRGVTAVRHHPAMPFAQVPVFIGTLAAKETSVITVLALKFLILTAARTSEVLNATWTEVDLGARVWTVPAGRMKSGRAHRVPLSEQCIAVLRQARHLGCGSALIFPGSNSDKPLSPMTLLMSLRRMRLPFVPHGFRSSFRDWAAETTAFPREVCEAALAHVVGDRTEAAYRRGDLFEKRGALMNAWSAYCCADAEPLSKIGFQEAAE